MESKFAPGFYSQKTELQYEKLTTEGTIPDWLDGALLRTGPGLFELEHQSYNHWYDGLSMLYKFSFRKGKVNFHNKFLQSNAYQKATASGKVQIKEWATDPCRTIFEKVKSYFIAPALTDNGNINIIQYGDEILATSETPLPIVFDTENLDTLNHFEFTDTLMGQIDPSHPQYDEDENIYSYLLKYSLISKYQVYTMERDSQERKVIKTIPTLTPAYMHSIAKTEKYLILVEFPFVVNPLELKFGDKPLIENYKWKPHLGTTYQIINLETGKVTRQRGEAFFAFHHVNAFEQGNELVLDVVTFEDASVVEALYLDELRQNCPTEAAGKLHRITLRLDEEKAPDMKCLCEKKVELPKINYWEYNSRPYRYAYFAGNTKEGNWLDDLTKIDVKTGNWITWYEEHCYPSEPVFVKRPGAQKEDEGVILSVVLNADQGKTFLLVLDAASFEEVGRAIVPQVIPFSFHGNYFHKL